MAEVNAKDLTTKTTPASTDSMLLFGTTSNEGAKITVDNLADNILGRLTTKTFANQVGGSSAATLLAQLSTLNSNIAESYHNLTISNEKVGGALRYVQFGKVVIVQGDLNVTAALSNGETIASGLPAPYAYTTAAPAIGFLATTGNFSKIRVTNTGELVSVQSSLTGYCNPVFVYLCA